VEALLYREYRNVSPRPQLLPGIEAFSKTKTEINFGDSLPSFGEVLILWFRFAEPSIKFMCMFDTETGSGISAVSHHAKHPLLYMPGIATFSKTMLRRFPSGWKCFCPADSFDVIHGGGIILKSSAAEVDKHDAGSNENDGDDAFRIP